MPVGGPAQASLRRNRAHGSEIANDGRGIRPAEAALDFRQAKLLALFKHLDGKFPLYRREPFEKIV